LIPIQAKIPKGNVNGGAKHLEVAAQSIGAHETLQAVTSSGKAKHYYRQRISGYSIKQTFIHKTAVLSCVYKHISFPSIKKFMLLKEQEKQHAKELITFSAHDHSILSYREINNA
jgi:hypothetical protein